MDQKIEIPLNKNKMLLSIIWCVLLTVIGVLLVFNNNFQNTFITLFKSMLLLKGIGIFFILFFGTIGVFGTKKLLGEKIGLTIDLKGIKDNTNNSSVGFINWDDILKIKTKKVLWVKFLLIEVINPEAYFETVKSKMKMKSMRENMKNYKTPITITSSTLAYSFEQLEALIQLEFKKYNEQKNE